MEFYLNLNKVNEETAKMNSGGGKRYFSRKNIQANSDVDIRILPPLKSLNGMYYLKVTSYWINRKNYISPATFGLECPATEAVKAINNGSNQALKALVKANEFERSEEYLIPILLLERNGSEVKVVDNCGKIFTATWGMIKQYNNFVTHRNYQNGSPLGIFDPVKGFNLTVGKTVSADRTSYTSMVWPTFTEIDSKFLKDIPDVYADTLEKMENQPDLGDAIQAYFGQVGSTTPADELPGQATTMSLMDRLKQQQ